MKAERLNIEALNGEVKAHLYQQLQRLEPYILLDGRLSFQSQEHLEDKANNHGLLKMSLCYQTPAFLLEAEGQGFNIFEASSQATEKMILMLSELRVQIASSPEYEAFFKQTDHTGYLH